jgi:hypothetical protein
MKKLFQTLTLLLYFSASFVQAGILDSFKHPSELILNQKNCQFGNGKKIEIVNGQVIVNNAMIVASIKKVDNSRVAFNFEDDNTLIILSISKTKDTLTAIAPSKRILIECFI